VPKSLLKKVTLADESLAVEEEGGVVGKPRPVLRADGSVAPLLIEALDLGTNQAAAFHSALGDFSREFNDLAQRHSVFTNTPPGTHGLGGVSKTLVTERFPEEGAALEQQLRQALQDALGAERAGVFWQQAKPDLLYHFNDFGRAKKKTTVVHDSNRFSPWFFVIRDVYETDDQRDYRSAHYEPDQLPAELRSWWPDRATLNDQEGAPQP
jgi:hypothetical protein